VLFGEIVGRQLKVKCPRCRTEHYHGWKPEWDASVPQPRSAHCAGAHGGYLIQPAPRVECLL
jgi:hypothetical protein